MSSRWLSGCLALITALLAAGAAGLALLPWRGEPDGAGEAPGEDAAGAPARQGWEAEAEGVAAHPFWRARVTPAVAAEMARAIRRQRRGAVVFIDDRARTYPTTPSGGRRAARGSSPTGPPTSATGSSSWSGPSCRPGRDPHGGLLGQRGVPFEAPCTSARATPSPGTSLPPKAPPGPGRLTQRGSAGPVVWGRRR